MPTTHLREDEREALETLHRFFEKRGFVHDREKVELIMQRFNEARLQIEVLQGEVHELSREVLA